MSKPSLVEAFLVRYSEALSQIGFNTREILRMSSQGLATKKSGISNT